MFYKNATLSVRVKVLIWKFDKMIRHYLNIVCHIFKWMSLYFIELKEFSWLRIYVYIYTYEMFITIITSLKTGNNVWNSKCIHFSAPWNSELETYLKHLLYNIDLDTKDNKDYSFQISKCFKCILVGKLKIVKSL